MEVVASNVEQLLLPVTVYMVLTLGVAITEFPVVALNPAEGDQE